MQLHIDILIHRDCRPFSLDQRKTDIILWNFWRSNDWKHIMSTRSRRNTNVSLERNINRNAHFNRLIEIFGDRKYLNCKFCNVLNVIRKVSIVDGDLVCQRYLVRRTFRRFHTLKIWWKWTKINTSNTNYFDRTTH